MVITEYFKINGVAFTRNYSDDGRYVVRDSVSYDEAIDLAELERTYIEGELIPIYDPEASAQEALNIILGEDDTK